MLGVVASVLEHAPLTQKPLPIRWSAEAGAVPEGTVLIRRPNRSSEPVQNYEDRT